MRDRIPKPILYILEDREKIKEMFANASKCLNYDMLNRPCVDTVNNLTGWLLTYVMQSPVCICNNLLTKEECNEYCRIRRELREKSVYMITELLNMIAEVINKHLNEMPKEERIHALALILAVLLFKYNTADFVAYLAKRLGIRLDERAIDIIEKLEPETEEEELLFRLADDAGALMTIYDDPLDIANNYESFISELGVSHDEIEKAYNMAVASIYIIR